MPPTDPFDQAFDQAVGHAKAGRPADAVEAWQRAAAITPERADVQYNLGNALKALDRLEDAAGAYRRAVQLDAGLAAAHYNLGGVLKDMGRLDEAAQAYRDAVDADPKDAEAHMNLGNALDLLGDDAAAAESLKRAVALDPGLAAAHFNLANVLRKAGSADEAEAGYRRALDLDPALPQVHDILGRIMLDRGDLAAALDHFSRAVDLDAESAAAHASLGDVYRKTGRLEDAEACCRRALSLDQDLAGAHDILGNVLMAQGRLGEAARCFRRAIALKPDFAEAQSDLGNALTDLGDLDGALKAYRTAMRLAEDGTDKKAGVWADACKNYLLALLYQPGLSNADLFEHYRDAVKSPALEQHASEQAAAPASPKKPGEKPSGRLRVGYVSSDFRYHPVGHNVLPLLAHHDHERVEVFCYAHTMGLDAITEAFRGHADHWCVINSLNDAAVAERMRADGIDVAVFLGGHFDENRPGVAAHRAAPVQVAMHGGATTAIDAMDYWLTDAWLHPENEGADGETGAERFTETLWRLPNFYAFSLPGDLSGGAPEVSPLPADENGFVTFVSFNKPIKMNDAVLDLWSEVLNAVPDSRLVLKYRNHLDPAVAGPTPAGPMLERLEANGIDGARIGLIGSMDDLAGHLAHYHQADIALDTFPFSGATTTFQALWMGVPVVSLHGGRFIGRMGASIIHHAGLGDLVASNPADYVEAAAALAGDLDRLRDLRAGLRRRVAASPLCDGRAYAQNVEDAFLAMRERTQTRP